MTQRPRQGPLTWAFALVVRLFRTTRPTSPALPGAPTRRSTSRKAAVGVLTVVATLIATMGVAFANAANPRPDAHGSATLISGTIQQNADGSYTVVSGHVDVSVGGTWDWLSQTGCKQRYGVGWAVDWHGLSTQLSVPGSVGAWKIKNTSTFFHIFEKDMTAQPSAGPDLDGNTYPFSDPCQQADASGHPLGPWGALHTYDQGSVIPQFLCVNMYDLHGTPGALSKASDIDPTVNTDNSIKTNSFNPGSGQGFCFTPVIKNQSHIETAATPTANLGDPISDNATLSAVAANASGTITFRAYLGACTVGNLKFTSAPFTVNGPDTYGTASFTPATVGTYNWIASYSGDGANAAAAGSCGDTGEVSVVTQPVQHLVGHIFDCTSGQTTNEVPGGTLSAAGPSIVAQQANPLDNNTVAAGQYVVTAGAPANFHFVVCGGNATVGNPPTSATNGATVPVNGTGTAVFYVAPNAPPPVQHLVGHIYSCVGGVQGSTDVPGGTLSAAGPTTVAQQANPMNASVAAGDYTVLAGAPSGFQFVTCGTGVTLIGNPPPIAASLPVTVPSGGTGNAIFYVIPIPAPPAQTLNGHIFDCTGNVATTTEVNGGTLSAAGPTTVGSQANPILNASVDAGDYTVTAGAPPGHHFVTCNSDFEIVDATHAHDAVTVPPSGFGTAIFYVAPDEGPPVQTLTGHIYQCISGVQSTQEVPGGTLSAAGPTSLAGQANPLSVSNVNAGDYVVTAGAPAGHDFVVCGSNTNVITTKVATDAVTVPVGNTGEADFYVIPTPPPPVQTLAGHIFDCPSGDTPTTTEVNGGTLSAAGPSTISSTPNPLSNSSVNAGDYTVTGHAPAGYHFVQCTSSANIITTTTATEPVTVPAGLTGTAVFYVQLDIPEPIETLQGHIYDCTSGPTTTEVTGGTLTAAGPSGIASQPNPINLINVKPGDYLVTGGAPSGYHFVPCVAVAAQTTGENLNIITPTVATQTINIPVGDTGNVIFFVAPNPPPPVQHLNGHIFDCTGGTATTDEVNGGTLSAAGPTTVPSQANPITNASVDAGQYVVTAGAPDGFRFVDCGSGANIITDTVATQSTTVPVNVDKTVVFYVEPIPPNELSITVEKTNDANNDGTFTDDETGTAGADVTFQVKVTNTSAVAVNVDSISDQVPGSPAFAPQCAGQFNGVTLQPGQSATCEFTVTNYVPTATQGAKVNTATVTVCDTEDDSSCTTGDDTSTVRGNGNLSITVEKTNDADGDGTFTDDETGTVGADVTFQVKVTNTSDVAVVIDSISDVWPGSSATTPACADQFIGLTLQPGASATCEFVVTGYVPPIADGAKINTVTVTVHEPGCETDCTTTGNDNTTVRGQEVLGEVVTPAAPLPRTGAGNTVGLAALGVLLIGLGSLLLLASKRSWQWQPMAALMSIRRETLMSVQLPVWMSAPVPYYAGPPVINREMRRSQERVRSRSPGFSTRRGKFPGR